MHNTSTEANKNAFKSHNAANKGKIINTFSLSRKKLVIIFLSLKNIPSWHLHMMKKT